MKYRKIFAFIVFLIFFQSFSSPLDLIEITSISPTIAIELRYAKSDNFTGQIIYPATAKAYLLRFVAEKLDQVQEYLKSKNLGLKIWDAYRPISAQWKLWEVYPDPRYVAPPEKGGRHTRGTTVDLTLVNLETGEELLMPTEFDNFTQKAHSDYRDLSDEILKNREILHNAMEKFGFKSLESEWWHFDSEGWQDYPALAIDF